MIGFHSGTHNLTQQEIDKNLTDLSNAFQLSLIVSTVVIVILIIEKIYVKYKNKKSKQ